VAGVAALVDAGAADVPLDDDGDYVVGQSDGAGHAAANNLPDQRSSFGVGSLEPGGEQRDSAGLHAGAARDGDALARPS